MTRTKSAVIAFVVLAGAVIIAASLDYTDTYVADRFNRALDARRYDPDIPFSLDTFLEYYDWDGVCVCAGPGDCPDLRDRLRLPYAPDAREGQWSLVLIKSYYVVAEIPVDRDRLDIPPNLSGHCFERWAAIVRIADGAEGKRLTFIGH